MSAGAAADAGDPNGGTGAEAERGAGTGASPGHAATAEPSAGAGTGPRDAATAEPGTGAGPGDAVAGADEGASPGHAATAEPSAGTGPSPRDAMAAGAGADADPGDAVAAGDGVAELGAPGRGGGGLSALAGLRVVELGVWVAAPATAALLADWGADVIKVESPAGDPMRSVFGSLGIGDDMPNPAFALDNRGKRSVVLDLRRPEDRQRFEDLLAGADVFISNLRPDALDKLGLEPEATVARHPHLVYCSVSGYGLRGDDRNRPTYDIGAFWARSGLAVQMSDRDGVPLNARGGIGDHVTGLAALSGVLAAVLEQRQTGRGRVVEVSLLRTGAYVLGWDLGIQMALGKVAGSEPRHRNQAPLLNSYRAGDGRWFFLTGLETARHLPAVCRALGRPDLLDDPRFAGASAIRRHRTEVIALLDEIIAERPLDEWAERFDREGVWWAPAHAPIEVVDDPQLVANDGFVEIPAGDGDATLRSVNGPVTFTAPTGGPGVPEEADGPDPAGGPGRSDPSSRSPGPAPVPRLGQHTDEVLAELPSRPARPSPSSSRPTPLRPGDQPGRQWPGTEIGSQPRSSKSSSE